MANRIRWFLWISLVGIMLLCTGVFVWITTYMIDENDKTISEVGEIYMSEMGQQISMHFATTIDLYQSELEGMATLIQQKTGFAESETYDDLSKAARKLGFSYLGLYSEGGSCDVVFGEAVHINEEDTFIGAQADGGHKIADGVNQAGDIYLFLRVPAEFTMKNGKASTELVGGLPMSVLSDILSLNIGATKVYSEIIRKDGTYVWKISDTADRSYFERILSYDNFEGKTPDKVVSEISDAMDAGNYYSLVLDIGGEPRNTHFTPLEYSDWYLASVLPYDLLNEPMSHLLSQRIYTAIGGCIVIVSVMLFIYYCFFHMSRQQMTMLEGAKKEAESANRAKSTFLSSMSHDIRTPMNAIMGMTAIACSNLDNPVKLKDCLKKITLSSQHLLGLINDVLDMSKIESGKMSLAMDIISLRDVMDSITCIVQPQIKAKKQSFDIFIDNINSEYVYCDGVRLNQVLLNLLSNAIKFTPEGGAIHVTLSQENSPLGESYVRTNFRIKDTGIGMSPEFQENIFDSFSRENTILVHKIEGTGLGMAITKYIVDEMNGTIELRSEVDKGTEFHIILDLKRGIEQEEDMALPFSEMLVVDDDEQLCRSTVSSLEEIGVKTDCAFDGDAAVEMIIKRNRCGKNYHAVLLDWKMPGMDGIETAKKIRSHVGRDVPIILISAYDWSEIEDEAYKAGINGFISKPLFKSTLFYGLKGFTDNVDEPESQKDAAPNYAGKRILLAEDNELNWEIVYELLSHYGFELERADDGRHCVDMFMASPSGFYDVILMDIRMPVMDGYDAAKEIRAADRPDHDIPIIAMTADAFAEDIKQCLNCGMDAHIAKPIDKQELFKVLRRFVDKQ